MRILVSHLANVLNAIARWKRFLIGIFAVLVVIMRMIGMLLL